MDLQGTLGGDCFGGIMDFSFYPFSINAIKLINNSEYLCILITNQSKIAKGLFTLEQFNKRLKGIEEEMNNERAYFDATYCCPHSRHDNCSCKKPLPGMIEEAVNDYDIDLENSYVIGDMGISDMILADKVGAKGILVLTGAGKDSLEKYKHLWEKVEPYHIAENVLEAVKWILSNSNI